MDKKEFVVFGLGRFGWSVATTLAESGCEVLAVDDNEDKIKDIADIVTYAVKADATDSETLSTLGLSNFDGAVIAMSEDLEASVMATILVKELGIPYVLVKAQTDLHAKILKKVGADMVVFPEKETGMRVAHNLIMGNFFDAVELSSTYSLMELEPLDEWDGKSLKDLNLRSRYKLNVIGIKQDDELNINPDADDYITKNDVLIVIGKNEILNKLKILKNKEVNS
ncbi:trk system potassium uptake protein TrkA [Mobilisporobacter senegalensis]|uniref:Trk system potassium uptake protein TrkA n=1 Tax=Mobilisporobacter senegalensis TaxID=1329262 RepID=A0A3N1XY23_9FIRM|nr:TrkA family potassium uptake protein [Mobilisporobacter senegalensis]ROR31513.1 trk system potassium uptake protein TrkA [Mobilisporobacter senegalensis]